MSEKRPQQDVFDTSDLFKNCATGAAGAAVAYEGAKKVARATNGEPTWESTTSDAEQVKLVKGWRKSVAEDNPKFPVAKPETRNPAEEWARDPAAYKKRAAKIVRNLRFS